MGAGRRADCDAPVEFPAGETDNGRGGNLCAGAREDAGEIGFDRRWSGPGRGGISGSQKEIAKRRALSWQARSGVSIVERGGSVFAAFAARIVRTCGA